jgi:quercetin dioxygenase-like cupin family protein
METLDYSNLRKYEFFPGVYGRVLLSGDNMTFFLVEVPAGSTVPSHSHPHEQMGICLSGEAVFTCNGIRKIVRKGMVYRIKSNEVHEVRVQGPENGLFLDVFSPPRLEYLEKQKLSERVPKGSASEGRS